MSWWEITLLIIGGIIIGGGVMLWLFTQVIASFFGPILRGLWDGLWKR